MTGPLLVLSERVGAEEESDDREVELRQIVIYDVGAEQYWTAFEYRNVRVGSSGGLSAVQPAGTSLVVWSEGQIRRMSLSGELEALLLEDHVIREIEVSPDGTKVAVMLGDPGTLLLLDAASGEELLRVESDNPDLGPLQGGARHGRLALGDWHADGNAVSITAGDYSGATAHTAVLRLDGDVRVLPEGALVSSDLRYAIHFGEVVGLLHHALVWDKLDVLDAVTGRVLWTITDEAGIRRSYKEPFWVDEWRYVAFTFASNGAERILDTASGEILPLTSRITRLPDGRVLSSCGAVEFGSAGLPCDVRYDGRVVWEGAEGWTRYLALIEAPDDVVLRGIAPVDVVRELPPPPPTGRDEFVGPILAYEVSGENQYLSDGLGGFTSIPTRRLIAYDAGTGPSWSLFNDPHWVQLARGGLVLVSDSLRTLIYPRLLYLTPEGQVEVLHDEWWWHENFRVSPDGLKVVLDGGSGVRVLSLPSADEVLHLDYEEIVSAAGLDTARNWRVRLADEGVAAAWTSDSAAILIHLVDYGAGDGPRDEHGGVLALDGAVRVLPCIADWYRTAYTSIACLSPDARYIVLGQAEGSDEYTGGRWRSFDVIDFETERVLWSLETASPLRNEHWEWASPNHFAWSDGADGSGVFIFENQRLDREAERADVSVLDVNTGEIEVMDSADYLARFHPPPRATTDCPEHPAQPCKILLDGEVVGEGRWLRIIGIIELD